MKKLMLFSLCGVMIVILCSGANAQWKRMNMNLMSGVDCLTADGDIIYAGIMYAGVFRSTDHGDSWHKIDGFTTGWWPFTMAVATLGDDIFIGGNGTSVVVSHDRGKTFAVSDSGLTIKSVGSFGFAFGRIFAGTANGGIFVSSDRGRIWSQSNSGIPSGLGWVNAFVVTDSAVGVGTDWGFFVSADTGVTWTQSNSGLADTSPQIVSFAKKGHTLFALTKYPQLYSSYNGGKTWHKQNIPKDYPTQADAWVFSVMADSVAIYVSTDSGILKSSDDGNTWIKISGFSYAQLLTRTSKELYCSKGYGVPGGIYSSGDDGATWKDVSSGLTALAVQNIVQYSNHLVVSTPIGIYDVSFLSPTTAIASRLQGIYVPTTVLALGDFLFAGEDSYPNPGTYVNSRVDSTWRLCSSTVPYSMALQGNRILTGGLNQVKISADTGRSWQNYGVSGLPGLDVCTSLVANDSTVFAGFFYAGVLRCRGVAGSWKGLQTGYQRLEVDALAMSDSVLVAGTDKGTMRSQDYGETWSIVDKSIAFSPRGGLIAQGTSRFFECGFGGIKMSEDRGRSWHSIAFNLPDTAVLSMAVFSQNLYVSTLSEGIWFLPLASIVTEVLPAKGSIPNDFSLQQNYPNPFNPSTTISYSLPKSATVTIKIFNTLGQAVALLVNGRKEAGYHQIVWNASVPSGIYFYRLQAGEFVETKKMVLLH